MAADLKRPAPVGILGIGGLGALAIQFAKSLGHRVVAIDNRVEGRDLAKSVPLPADLVVDYNAPDVIEQIQHWSGQDGLSAIIVCTDNIEATEWSLETLAVHGTCVPLGLPPSGWKFNAFTAIFKELTIRGSLVASREQCEDMMKAVARALQIDSSSRAMN
jgi:D-arabinose 1-dehydrogenase-like Zn-dependent alcohol dehydrogenase